MSERATFSVELKAVGDSAKNAGEFEAIVAVFDNVDDGGDRIHKGAFADAMKEGYPPIVWSHEWGTVPIGVVQDMKETNTGLFVKGRLFVGEGEDHPLARQVYTAMKSEGGDGRPALREFSFGYRAGEVSYPEGEEKAAPHHYRDIHTIARLFEVGPTLVGMNPKTELLSVKGACPACGGTKSQHTEDSTSDQTDQSGEGDVENAADTIALDNADDATLDRLVDLLIM